LALSLEILLSMATMAMSGRLLDCILICIANWTLLLGSFTKGIAY
jgi:hypothetical protein